MSEENKNMKTQDNPAETGAQGQGTDKLFTQEEVNSFVQSRIARMKSQIEKQSRSEYETKLQELQQREMKLIVKEALSERGMPKELSEVITCSDEDDMNSKLDKLDKLAKIYSNQTSTPKEKLNPMEFHFGASSNQEGSGQDPIRAAMGIKQKG